jgi:predicted glycosyltransferase involved in capsule biosynthesis
LETNDACHLGATVIYADEPSTKRICQKAIVDDTTQCERVVGYFEGGSLACKVQTYWKIGGFCEDYYGYGCEDCDFYYRLSHRCKWSEQRVYDFLHLWHGRAPQWGVHHKKNRQREAQLGKMPLPERVKHQHKRLREQGWGTFLNKAIAK